MPTFPSILFMASSIAQLETCSEGRTLLFVILTAIAAPESTSPHFAIADEPVTFFLQIDLNYTIIGISLI